MIKINLASRKSANFLEQETIKGTRMGLGGGTSISLSSLKDIPNLRSLVLVGIVAFVGSHFLDGYKSDEIAAIQAEAEKLRGEQSTLAQEISQSARFEEIKKSLEADELVIRSKLDAIQSLMQDRSTPSKLLMAIAASVPAEVWFSELSVDPTTVTIKGDSTEPTKISDFMKNLGESAFIKDVVLKGMQQAKSEQGGETARFELTMGRR